MSRSALREKMGRQAPRVAGIWQAPLLLLVAGGSGGGGGRCGVRLLLHRWLVCDAQVGHLLGGLGGGLGLWGHRGAGGWEEVGGEELVHLGGW